MPFRCFKRCLHGFPGCKVIPTRSNMPPPSSAKKASLVLGRLLCAPQQAAHTRAQNFAWSEVKAQSGRVESLKAIGWVWGSRSNLNPTRPATRVSRASLLGRARRDHVAHGWISSGPEQLWRRCLDPPPATTTVWLSPDPRGLPPRVACVGAFQPLSGGCAFWPGDIDPESAFWPGPGTSIGKL